LHDAGARSPLWNLTEVPPRKAWDVPRWAYVMMAYDPPGEPPGDSLWGALAMARALQRVSHFPLVLLTNTTRLPDGTDLVEGFAKLNTRVVPVHEVQVPGAQAWTFKRWNIAFWKLQAFRLVDYEKLIWLDSDAIAYRSLDWVFTLPGMRAQRDDWFCRLNEDVVCSGILSIVPSTQDFWGLLKFATEVGSMLVDGDQQLISMYFRQRIGRPVELLDDVDASFGQCAGKAMPTYLPVDTNPGGIWTTPGFLHKSGGWGDTNNNVYSNVCFQHNLTRQRYKINDVVLNVCHLNPIAAYWRDRFCEAVKVVGTHMHSVMTFCSDSCYFHGVHPDGVVCKQYDRSVEKPEWRGPLNATTGHRDPSNILPVLAVVGSPIAEVGEAPPGHAPKPVFPKVVLLKSYDMSKWSCGGKCPHGGCCEATDCAAECQRQDACATQIFNSATQICNMFTRLVPTWSSDGGRSGPLIKDSLVWHGARYPEAGDFTITARIRSNSSEDCQDIIAWGDGQGSWMSAEFRLSSGGGLLYGENPSSNPVANTWVQVQTPALGLNNGTWKDIAVSRHKSGDVALYVDGKQVANATGFGAPPNGLLPRARSGRVAHTQDCVFIGNITDMHIYGEALTDNMVFAVVHGAAGAS